MNIRFSTRHHISFGAMVFAAIATFIYRWTGYNIMDAVTPVILSLVGIILLHGLLSKIVAIPLNYLGVIPTRKEKQPEISLKNDSYETLLAENLQKEQKRKRDTIQAIREYVTVVTSGYLSKASLDTLLENIENMASGNTDACKPLRSNMEKKLKSPDLRHLAWNIGERLGVSRPERAKFILASFPSELKNATLEYLEANLRDTVPCHIKIDVPDKGDYRVHYVPDNAA